MIYLVFFKFSNNSLISSFEDCLPKLILNEPSICSSDIFKADKMIYYEEVILNEIY